jgi:hypothetical protein
VSVEFDPVPLGRPRRRVEPVALLVVAIIAGLALAVLKPWQSSDDKSNGVAVASPSAATPTDAASSVAPGLRIDIVTVDRSSSTRPLGHPVYAAEYLTPSPDGPTELDPGGRSIVALGVAPHAEGVVEAVRIWRVGPAGALESLEAAPVGGVATGGAVVLAPSGQLTAFAPGRYRIEAVVDGETRQLDVTIPEQLGTTTPPSPGLSWAAVERSGFPNPVFAVDVVTVDWSASTGSAGYPVYFEGWHTPGSDGPTVLDTRGQSIVALGVATEPGAIAEDVRIWRVRADGDLEWVDANPIDDAIVGGPLVLAIPGRAIAFPAGRYRVDALVEGTIRRVDVGIPGPDGTVPPPNVPAYPDVTRLVPLASSDPSAVLDGPFATVDGVGRALRAAPVDPLDETGAWAASLAGLDPAARPTVARVYLTRATGLGVMLPSHARIQTAGIARLAPDVPLGPITSVGGVSSNHGGAPWVGFAAPDDRAWPPGVYAMTVAWMDGPERHVETWHVELRPGPSTPSAPAPG